MLILCIKDFEMSTKNQYFDYFSVLRSIFNTFIKIRGAYHGKTNK